jgi:hypothetical protein
MANLGQVYDADSLPEGQDFSPIPDGWYIATVSKSELKQTKAALIALEIIAREGKGAKGTEAKDEQYINLQWSILGPTCQGRVLFDMINLRNKSADAERIGLGQLRQLILATGVGRINDDQQLVGATCQIKVALGKAQNGYEAKSEVKQYKAADGSVAPRPSFAQSAPKTATVPAGVAPAPTTSAPPWAKH